MHPRHGLDARQNDRHLTVDLVFHPLNIVDSALLHQPGDSLQLRLPREGIPEAPRPARGRSAESRDTGGFAEENLRCQPEIGGKQIVGRVLFPFLGCSSHNSRTSVKASRKNRPDP